MLQPLKISVPNEQSMASAGASLARTLYTTPLTIGLSGDLGAGKTTFLRGFLRELGVDEHVVSPTYALEQHYTTARFPIEHLDLYRLSDPEARRFLRERDEPAGIRCIEWVGRAGEVSVDIALHIEEDDSANRIVRCNLTDCDWPDDDTIDAWRKDVHLPENVAKHCDAVAALAMRLADELLARGVIVRKKLLSAAARTHDLFRFINFRPEAAPPGYESSSEDVKIWETWKGRFPFPTHEEAVDAFLRDRQFPAVATIVRTHGVQIPPQKNATVEQALLYYADKRLIGDRVVSIAERYRDFGERYGKGQRSPDSLRWEQESLAVEHELFPNGIPF